MTSKSQYVTLVIGDALSLSLSPYIYIYTSIFVISVYIYVQYDVPHTNKREKVDLEKGKYF